MKRWTTTDGGCVEIPDELIQTENGQLVQCVRITVDVFCAEYLKTILGIIEEINELLEADRFEHPELAEALGEAVEVIKEDREAEFSSLLAGVVEFRRKRPNDEKRYANLLQTFAKAYGCLPSFEQFAASLEELGGMPPDATAAEAGSLRDDAIRLRPQGREIKVTDENGEQLPSTVAIRFAFEELEEIHDWPHEALSECCSIQEDCPGSSVVYASGWIELPTSGYLARHGDGDRVLFAKDPQRLRELIAGERFHQERGENGHRERPEP